MTVGTAVAVILIGLLIWMLLHPLVGLVVVGIGVFGLLVAALR